ncbi:hypothetical protein EV702DRAFT_1046373 [Suillus placidus]|uniref:Uncharacterized protein n=1 Tax=Suillus placidus TaxID=48579 RepID=A0A9P7D2N1_9AGAM|nr:hypothetical protein EV702DRAFT_1046373 [Suillus placidus]
MTWKYRQWFHNHKKHHTKSKASTKPQKKWTACQVIQEERKADILQQIHEEIEEETGHKPTAKKVLRRYQPTMTAIMQGLEVEELQEAQAKADLWTNQVPDAAVQAKTAKKQGEKMVKKFTKEMFTQAGMRVFVLGSWKDEKGSLLTSGFDFNEQLGNGSSFMKWKDWQVILPGWEDFISNAFDQDQDQDVMLLGGTRRVPKPYHEFELDHSGLPILPEINSYVLETQKAMIRSFLTIHYRICCRKPKVPVPWHDIMKGQSRFISSTYLPDDTKSVEPSKMHCVDANAILAFWWNHQETQVGATFKFKGWMDDKGRMRRPVDEDESDGDADDESPRPTKKSLATSSLSTIPKGQPRTTKLPYVSLSEDESNNAEGEASPPQAQRCPHGCTNAEERDLSDDRPIPKSLGKRVRGHEDQPMPSHHRSPPTATKTSIPAPQVTEDSDNENNSRNAAKASHLSTHAGHHGHGFGPNSTCRGLEHLWASLTAQEPALRRTRATRDASLVVQDSRPKKMPAPRDHSPKKTKAARLAAGIPSDAPAKGTRSNAENLRATRSRQKPKRYADYV